MQKRCPKCGETKPLERGFYVLQTGRVSGYCRACVAADKRARYPKLTYCRRSADGSPIVYVAGDYAFWFAATISLFSAVYLIGFVTIAIKRRSRRLRSPTA